MSENITKTTSPTLSVFLIFIAFYSMIAVGFGVHYHTDIIAISKLAIIEHSWFSIGAAFLFLGVLTTPIRLFISNKLDQVHGDLFLYKSKEEQKSNIIPITLLALVISSMFTSFAFIFSAFYGFILELFIEELKTSKLVPFLFFSYMTILTWFSLELLMIEKITKTLLEDILKIDKFKFRTVVRIENLYAEKYKVFNFRQYATSTIFFPDYLPLTYNDESIKESITKFEQLDSKSRTHRRLSIEPEDISLIHNLKKNSNLVYLAMQFRKTTRIELDEYKEKVIKLIKNKKINEAFAKNIKEANDYLNKKNKNTINLHSQFNPIDPILKDNLTTFDVFKKEIKLENEGHKILLNNHREYLLEILRRS